MCCLTWKAQSATIKILAFMLKLAGRLAALCWVNGTAVFYTEDLAYSWCTNHLYKHILPFCVLCNLRHIYSIYLVNKPYFTVNTVHWDVKCIWGREDHNPYRQYLSMSENMAPSRKGWIEILCLDIAEHHFCSTCINLNISIIIDLNC
jgi:hypothetical protein